MWLPSWGVAYLPPVRRLRQSAGASDRCWLLIERVISSLTSASFLNKVPLDIPCRGTCYSLSSRTSRQPRTHGIWSALKDPPFPSKQVTINLYNCLESPGYGHHSMSVQVVAAGKGKINVLCCLISFQKQLKYFDPFLSFFHTDITPVLEDPRRGRQGHFILHSQYRCCWWPGDARNRGISNHGTGLFCLEYYDFCIRRFNTLAMGDVTVFCVCIYSN